MCGLIIKKIWRRMRIVFEITWYRRGEKKYGDGVRVLGSRIMLYFNIQGICGE
jgi:hypothetical protein